MNSLNIIFSSLALLISITSLFMSIRTSNRNWERQVRLPYYKELMQFVDDVEEIFSHEIGIYRVPSFDHVRYTAKSLGLYDISADLFDIELTMKKLDEDRRMEDRDIPGERRNVELIRGLLNNIRAFIYNDTERLK